MMSAHVVAAAPAVSTPAITVPAARFPLRHEPFASVPEEYMNSREAAAYLHVKHRTLLEWARLGIIPGIPLGSGTQRKTWLFCKSSLDEHLRGIMTAIRPHSIQETAYVN
jgi:hypothetical protein